MAENDSNTEKEIEYWKKVATRLALALAVMIFASGIFGSWITFENRALKGYKSFSEPQLKMTRKNVLDELGKKTNELKECKAKNEELMKAILKLKVENADLKALLDE